MKTKLLVGVAAALGLALPPTPTAAQSVAVRTPNLGGGWTAPPGVVQFNFLHRFSVSDAPLRKVTNTPTFHVGTGVVDGLMVGFTWGSNSSLVPAYPNEWELFGRALPLAEERGDPLDLSVQAGYNTAAESVDGELLLARSVGPLRVLAAGRVFSDAYEGEEARWAVAGGASLRLTPSISLAGDYGVLLDREDDEPPVWSAGVQMGVPYTPHSFSVHASNVGTASLEGASRGTRTRWGFEYTVPVNLGRYLPRGRDDQMGGEMEPAMEMEEEAMAEPAMTAGADTVVIEIQDIAYGTDEVVVAPGTTVRWVNRDPIQHSVTGDDGSFDSGLLDPGAAYTRTFPREGAYVYHCTPHPFMQGRVVVRPMNDAGGRRAAADMEMNR